MKILALLGAGLIAAGTVAVAPASAQHYHGGHGHAYGRHGGYGHGYRYAGGYRHGYYRGHRGYERCRVFYRHGDRIRRCY